MLAAGIVFVSILFCGRHDVVLMSCAVSHGAVFVFPDSSLAGPLFSGGRRDVSRALTLNNRFEKSAVLAHI